MKFLAYISTFFLLLVLSSGCDKFLQKDLLTAVTEENFYQTEEDALAALYAAYSTLQYDGQLTPSGQFRWFWGDVVSDDTDKGGSGPNDAASLGRLERFEGSSNNELLHAEWLADYDAIYYSNVVLDKVPGIEMDPFKRDQILGEAKFIRAWGYYQLVTMFGGVPLVDKVLSPSEDLIPRASEDEIWDFIEKNLISSPHPSEVYRPPILI